VPHAATPIGPLSALNDASNAAACDVRNTSTPAGRFAQTPAIRRRLGERVKSTRCRLSKSVHVRRECAQDGRS
jgi:hypothetical protein